MPTFANAMAAWPEHPLGVYQAADGATFLKKRAFWLDVDGSQAARRP